MPSGQAMLDAIVASGAITYRPGWQTAFIVSYRLLRQVLRPEHRALAAAGMVNRTDSGTMTLTPIGGGTPVTIPATLIIGADGTPQSAAGGNVGLNEPATSGKILIAAAGDGVSPAAPGPGGLGGDASVLALAENLLIALGGHGGDAFVMTSPAAGANGFKGGSSGDSVVVGLGEANSCWAQCSRGGAGSPGAMGTPPVPGRALFGYVIVAPTPASPNGTSGEGGCGGDAFATSGRGSSLDVRAGNKGIDGPVLPGYPAATAPPAGFGAVTYPTAAGNLTTIPAFTCGGGNAAVDVAPGSNFGQSAGLPNGQTSEYHR
jgi:pilus assembly protein FimV